MGSLILLLTLAIALVALVEASDNMCPLSGYGCKSTSYYSMTYIIPWSSDFKFRSGNWSWTDFLLHPWPEMIAMEFSDADSLGYGTWTIEIHSTTTSEPWDEYQVVLDGVCVNYVGVQHNVIECNDLRASAILAITCLNEFAPCNLDITVAGIFPFDHSSVLYPSSRSSLSHDLWHWLWNFFLEYRLFMALILLYIVIVLQPGHCPEMGHSGLSYLCR